MISTFSFTGGNGVEKVTCPKSHKYAYENGDWCCQTNEDCWDKKLTLSSYCCKNRAYTECQGKKCTNHPSGNYEHDS